MQAHAWVAILVIFGGVDLLCCPLSEVSCRRMGCDFGDFLRCRFAVCSAAVTAVGCSDALEPGGSRGVVFLPLWVVLVGCHSLSAEGVSVIIAHGSCKNTAVADDQDDWRLFKNTP